MYAALLKEFQWVTDFYSLKLLVSCSMNFDSCMIFVMIRLFSYRKDVCGIYNVQVIPSYKSMIELRIDKIVPVEKYSKCTFTSLSNTTNIHKLLMSKYH